VAVNLANIKDEKVVQSFIKETEWLRASIQSS